MRDETALKMFGCTEAVLRSMFDNAAGFHDPKMVTASILSDVQELMEVVAASMPPESHGANRLEICRQYLNRAKWGLFEYLQTKPDKEPP